VNWDKIGGELAT